MAKLKVLPGAKFYLGNKASIHAQSDMDIQGTADKPILFTWLVEHSHWGALSNFEANSNYKDVQDPAITVRFRVTEGAEQLGLNADQRLVTGRKLQHDVDAGLLPNQDRQREGAQARAGHSIEHVNGVNATSAQLKRTIDSGPRLVTSRRHHFDQANPTPALERATECRRLRRIQQRLHRRR